MSQTPIFTKIQYAGETAYGTEGSSYNELARVQSCNMESENSFIYDYGVGEGLNSSNTYYGPFRTRGDISYSIVDFDFLKHWVGPKSGSGTAGDPYVLTEATSINVNTSSLQPFSIERYNDTESTASTDYMTGCVGTNFTISGSIGTKVECQASFFGQKSAYRTTGETYTPVTDPAFIMLNGSWKWGATPTALAGVREFTLSMTTKTNPDDTRSVESRFIGMPVIGIREYKFTVGIIMASALSTTIITDFYGGGLVPNTGSTSVSPTADLEFEVALVNGNKYATLWLDQCSIDKISKPTDLGGGIVLLTFEGTARLGKGNTPIKWWTV